MYNKNEHQHPQPLRIYWIPVTKFTCLLMYPRVGKVNKKGDPEASKGWVRSERVTLRSRHFNIISLKLHTSNAYDNGYR